MDIALHLFGPTNHYPTGQRGLFAWWRTGTDALAPNAFRYLEIKAQTSRAARNPSAPSVDPKGPMS